MSFRPPVRPPIKSPTVDPPPAAALPSLGPPAPPAGVAAGQALRMATLRQLAARVLQPVQQTCGHAATSAAAVAGCAASGREQRLGGGGGGAGSGGPALPARSLMGRQAAAAQGPSRQANEAGLPVHPGARLARPPLARPAAAQAAVGPPWWVAVLSGAVQGQALRSPAVASVDWRQAQRHVQRRAGGAPCGMEMSQGGRRNKTNSSRNGVEHAV